MERRRLAGFGLALGLLALSGCVGAPPPQVALVPAPMAASAPVVLTPVPLALPPAEPDGVPVARHHAARIVHPVDRHRWVHRYVARAYFPPASTPQCGG